jgi:hypothetical protein
MKAEVAAGMLERLVGGEMDADVGKFMHYEGSDGGLIELVW